MAKRDISALISAAGWLASFADGLIKALHERGISDEEIHKLVTDEGILPMAKIADALVEVIQQTKNISRLVVSGNRTTEEVVRAGKYDEVNRSITNENFPIRPQPVGNLTIELLNFGRLSFLILAEG